MESCHLYSGFFIMLYGGFLTILLYKVYFWFFKKKKNILCIQKAGRERDGALNCHRFTPQLSSTGKAESGQSQDPGTNSLEFP